MRTEKTYVETLVIRKKDSKHCVYVTDVLFTICFVYLKFTITISELFCVIDICVTFRLLLFLYNCRYISGCA